jgi:hypothetical protein
VRQRRERGGRDTLLGLASWAAGLFLVWAEAVPPGPFLFLFLLFFFFFYFLIPFIDFAKLLQINSNHFQEFSKIQSIKVGQ